MHGLTDGHASHCLVAVHACKVECKPCQPADNMFCRCVQHRPEEVICGKMVVDATKLRQIVCLRSILTSKVDTYRMHDFDNCDRTAIQEGWHTCS